LTCHIQPYRDGKICCLTHHNWNLQTTIPILGIFLPFEKLHVQILTTGARPQYLRCTGKNQNSSAVKNQWVLTVMPINVLTTFAVGVDIGTMEKPYWCQPNIWLLHCLAANAQWFSSFWKLQEI
jgi:hypothetical protein